MISTFFRAQWESGELEDVDDERRQILEEAAELDHIWGVWEGRRSTLGPRWVIGGSPIFGGHPWVPAEN